MSLRQRRVSGCHDLELYGNAPVARVEMGQIGFGAAPENPTVKVKSVHSDLGRFITFSETVGLFHQEDYAGRFSQT